MTPLSQMQATKNLLTEAHRIAYVGFHCRCGALGTQINGSAVLSYGAWNTR